MVKKSTKRTRKTTFLGQLGSKRFLAACGATVLFAVMLYTTHYGPIELATAITMIMGVYVGVETLKPSVTPMDEVTTTETTPDDKKKRNDKH
jgi:hypothetical protein